jgi:type IV pilus assembly protein PilA
MRSEITAKFIQNLNNKDRKEGFTLIELLVVIVIIGILGAIAIPNFLNQDVKAKQSEAKQNIGTINKTQNSFRAENNTFATSFDALAIGSVTGGTTGSTTNYNYTLSGATDSSTVIASPADTALKGYSGGAVRFSNGANQSVIGTVLCEMKIPGAVATLPTTVPGTTPACTPANQTTLSL